MAKKESRISKIKKSIRAKVSGTPSTPRLTVFRSNKNIYAQLIDDNNGKTLISSTSNTLETKGKTKVDLAKLVGAEIASKAKVAGITSVVFDRNGRLYHGRVKALAEGAREGGLIF